MSRYIEADALIKRIQDEHKFGSLMLSNMIADMPTADVVEVVRCKDCTKQLICYHSDDYYCADGERREDEKGRNTTSV